MVGDHPHDIDGEIEEVYTLVGLKGAGVPTGPASVGQSALLATRDCVGSHHIPGAGVGCDPHPPLAGETGGPDIAEQSA